MYKLLGLLCVWALIALAHGKVHPNVLIHRIMGGREINIEDAPHQVAIYMISENNAMFVCGGSIVSEFYILTAAHCQADPNQFPNPRYLINAGTNNMQEMGQIVNVTMVTPHPNYDKTRHILDIMVLKLDKALTFNDQVQPIQLPRSGFEVPENEDLMVSGWGKISYHAPDPSFDLLAVTVPNRNAEVCINAYRTISIELDAEVIICAGSPQGGKDACKGDSGGPLVYRDPDTAKPILAGVVSMGEECGLAEFPGVYTKVAKALEFITNITGPL